MVTRTLRNIEAAEVSQDYILLFSARFGKFRHRALAQKYKAFLFGNDRLFRYGILPVLLCACVILRFLTIIY